MAKRILTAVRTLRENLPQLLLALTFAILVKAQASAAPPEELGWLIRPAAWLLTWVAGVRFDVIPGVGWVSFEHRVIFAKSCAGSNFLALAAVFLVWAALRGQAGRFRKWLAFGGGLAGAYGLTVLVNAIRVGVSIWLYKTGWSWGFLTPDRIHRLLGIVLYFGLLSLVCLLVLSRQDRRTLAGEERPRLSPRPSISGRPCLWGVFGAYTGLVILISLIGNPGAIRNAGFRENALWAAGAALLIVLLLRVLSARVHDGGGQGLLR